MDNKDLRKKLGVLKRKNPSAKRIGILSPPRLLSSGQRTASRLEEEFKEEDSLKIEKSSQRESLFPPLSQNGLKPRPPLTSKPSELTF